MVIFTNMSNLLLSTTKRWISQSPLKSHGFLLAREMLPWRKELQQTIHKFHFSSMSESLNALPGELNTSNQNTIFRVPYKIRKNCEALIEPSVVSIGPYHHGRKHLKAMQDLKWSLLQDFQSRGNNKVSMKACKEKIKGQQLQARNCYSGRIKMADNDFVEMLILDGAFIIEFALKLHDQHWFSSEVGWSATFIEHDLIMLENQIPFFVVESLWELIFGKPPTHRDLKDIADKFCNGWMSRRVTTPPKKIDHLLHLCHHYVVPDMSSHQALPQQRRGLNMRGLLNYISSQESARSKNRAYKGVSGPQLPCASKLREAGIKFRSKSIPCELMDVTFQGGTLEIPHIDTHHGNKPLFKNLLALEQSAYTKGHLTAYTVFMDSIINSEDDIEVLQRKGIIENTISGEREIALFFNQLGDGVTTSRSDYLSDLVYEVNQHCKSKFGRYRAQLMHNYFHSPWAAISFLGALLALVLSGLQTRYAYRALHHSSPK